MISTGEALSHEEQPSLTCEHLLALGRELAASLKGETPGRLLVAVGSDPRPSSDMLAAA